MLFFFLPQFTTTYGVLISLYKCTNSVRILLLCESNLFGFIVIYIDVTSTFGLTRVGHNLGRGHSGEDGDGEYADQSGYMVSFLLFLLSLIRFRISHSSNNHFDSFLLLLYFRGTDMV
jgi:hypothetical protein